MESLEQALRKKIGVEEKSTHEIFQNKDTNSVDEGHPFSQLQAAQTIGNRSFRKPEARYFSILQARDSCYP